MVADPVASPGHRSRCRGRSAGQLSRGSDFFLNALWRLFMAFPKTFSNIVPLSRAHRDAGRRTAAAAPEVPQRQRPWTPSPSRRENRRAKYRRGLHQPRINLPFVWTEFDAARCPGVGCPLSCASVNYYNTADEVVRFAAAVAALVELVQPLATDACGSGPPNRLPPVSRPARCPGSRRQPRCRCAPARTPASRPSWR